MIFNINELYENGISKENIYINEPMKKHTSLKIGGPADIFVKAKNTEEIKIILDYAKKNKIPIHIIGNGSNVLVKDEGIRGIVLKVENKKLDIQEKENYVEVKVGSGMPLAMLAQKLLQQEISGFEELAGIPGTIGGAIRMNAGAYGKEIKDIVVKTTYLNEDGKQFEINNDEHEFEYRNSMFSKYNYVILETVLKLYKGQSEEILKEMQKYAKSRKEKQPLEFPNAGSTFKRENDFITAELIDKCGLKGYKVGGAQVSVKHAGFIVNTGDATADDVLKLIEYIKEEVYKKFNKKIKLEIQVM